MNVGIILGISLMAAGFIASLVSSLWWLLGFEPTQERYTDARFTVPGAVHPGLRRLARDQQRVVVLAVFGVALQAGGWAGMLVTGA